MKLLDRRRFLTLIGGSAAGLTAAGRATASTSTTHRMWMLDPDWGFDLDTDTGSDTKSRCRGRACHLAATHRFFLTEADAIAGRLHHCCLAQPVAVDVCIDMNELLPYYGVHRSGWGGYVDARCPELPDHLRTALYAATPCGVITVPVDDEEPGDTPPTDTPPPPGSPDPVTTGPSPAPAPPAQIPTSQPPPTAATPDLVPGVPQLQATPAAPPPATTPPPRPSPSSLPATGIGVAGLVVAGAAATAAGLAARQVAETAEPDREPPASTPEA